MAHYTAREVYRIAREAGFAPDQAVTMTAIALAESGGETGAHNPRGEDSRGLWQINVNAHRDWTADMDLYDPLVNARAAFRISGQGSDVSPWTTVHGGAGASYLKYRSEAQAAAVAHGDPAGLGQWSGTPGYGHRMAAGSATDEGTASPVAAFPEPADGQAPESSPLQVFLDAAVTQAGDRYIFGTETDMADPDPEAFDCSELVQWAAGRAGVQMVDGSWHQYLQLEQQASTVSVQEAMATPGALLFSFSSPPGATSGRPSQAHVAISLGDGRTIEARGTRYGVGSWEATEERFQYAAVIPGISGQQPAAGPPPVAVAAPAPSGEAGAGAASDTDGDGLTSDLEGRVGTDAALLDTDGDGLSDGYEVTKAGTDPLHGDTDADGTTDAVEYAVGTSPLVPDGAIPATPGTVPSPRGGALLDADSDGDGLGDRLERILRTDPASVDSDADGFTDGAEQRDGFDPSDPADNALASAALPEQAGSPDTAEDVTDDRFAVDFSSDS